jgi:hypothetical protein
MRLKQIIIAIIIVTTLYLGWIKIRSLDIQDGGAPLAIRWEGLFHDYNLRDVGASVNQCLNRKMFVEGTMWRSAVWFSGWSCDSINNPDVIFSLNYSPTRKERYFCQGDNGKTVGTFLKSTVKLNNLEFIETWRGDEARQTACRFISEIMNQVIQRKKILIHCDAGRDRTGALSGLLIALAAEAVGKLDQSVINAIECDYRKTKTLNKEKYGRLERFIDTARQRGSLADFLSDQCGTSTMKINQFASQLIRTDHPQPQSAQD